MSYIHLTQTGFWLFRCSSRRQIRKHSEWQSHRSDKSCVMRCLLHYSMGIRIAGMVFIMQLFIVSGKGVRDREKSPLTIHLYSPCDLYAELKSGTNVSEYTQCRIRFYRRSIWQYDWYYCSLNGWRCSRATFTLTYILAILSYIRAGRIHARWLEPSNFGSERWYCWCFRLLCFHSHIIGYKV